MEKKRICLRIQRSGAEIKQVFFFLKENKHI